jgi:alpha-L-fucosidase 2
MPIGNGRMGTLVWTTPSALHFQINRVDLSCMGNNTRSFPKGHTDYSSDCGYMDINVVDYGDDVFTGKAFNQHLQPGRNRAPGQFGTLICERMSWTW